MKTFKSFQEYLNDAGKMQDKAITNPTGNTAPKPTRTPPEPNGKNLEVKTTGKPAPYMPPGSEPGPQKYEKGLGNQGDKKLIYEPSTKNTNPDDWKKETTWPKTKTEEFIDATKNMSLSELTKRMIDGSKPNSDCPAIFAPKEGYFQPSAYEAVRYVTHLATTNESVMESLVMEFVNKQGIGKLMEELFKYKESYQEAVTVIDSVRFANTIKEMTSPPASVTEGDDDEKASSSAKKKINKASKTRSTSSVEGEPMDINNSGAVQSKLKK